MVALASLADNTGCKILHSLNPIQVILRGVTLNITTIEKLAENWPVNRIWQGCKTEFGEQSKLTSDERESKECGYQSDRVGALFTLSGSLFAG